METVFPGEEGLGDAASVRFDGLLQEHSLKYHRLHRSMGRCVRMLEESPLAQFVMFFQDFHETSVIQRLIVLQKNEHQIEFAEGQFEMVDLMKSMFFRCLKMLRERGRTSS